MKGDAILELGGMTVVARHGNFDIHPRHSSIVSEVTIEAADVDDIMEFMSKHKQ
jgi:hypothetical protein